MLHTMPHFLAKTTWFRRSGRLIRSVFGLPKRVAVRAAFPSARLTAARAESTEAFSSVDDQDSPAG